MATPPTMSGANNKQPAASGQPGAPSFPPPPPGGPPGHGAPDQSYQIPSYNPNNPTFAPPPRVESDIYNDSEDETPPPKPPRPENTTAPAAQQQKPSKMGWADKLASFGMKAAAPINALAHKMGSEAFLPSTMDQECEKAARILRAFCKQGVYNETEAGTAHAPEANTSAAPAAPGKETTTAGKEAKPRKNRTLLHIPSKVVSRAVGLAIFTTVRLGYGVTGASGSGVLIARLPDGRWSPPSGIHIHTVGAGFVIGVDIYDCVIVINTREALEAFTRTRMSLGTDLAVVAGPWGAGGGVDFAAPDSKDKKGKGKDVATAGGSSPVDAPGAAAPAQPTSGAANLSAGTGQPPVMLDQQPTTPTGGHSGSNSRQPSPFRQSMKPVYSYVKSRGFYAGVQIDGTVVNERKDANAAFYGVNGITVGQILKGEVPHVAGMAWERHSKPLLDVVRGAEGYTGGGDQLEPPTTLMSNLNVAGDVTSNPPAAATVPSKAQEAGYQAPPPPASTAPVASGSTAPVTTAFPPPPTAPVASGSAAPVMTTFPPPPPGPPPANTGAPPAMNWKEREAAAEAAAFAAQTAAPPPAMNWKEREAAAEAAAAGGQSSAPPPTYSEFDSTGDSGGPSGQSSDLPPAYVDDGQVRPGVGDSKTGQP